jgi:hypothetical protein
LLKRRNINKGSRIQGVKGSSTPKKSIRLKAFSF